MPTGTVAGSTAVSAGVGTPQSPFTPTPTIPLSLALSTPGAVATRTASSGGAPDAGLIAFVAIVSAIAIAAVLIFTLGPKRAEPPEAAGGTGEAGPSGGQAPPPSQAAGIEGSAPSQLGYTRSAGPSTTTPSSGHPTAPPTRGVGPAVTSVSGGKPPVRFETRPRRAVSSVDGGQVYRPDYPIDAGRPSPPEADVSGTRSFEPSSSQGSVPAAQGVEDSQEFEGDEDLGDGEEVGGMEDSEQVEADDEREEDDAPPWAR
jgi:hypothetical protein